MSSSDEDWDTHHNEENQHNTGEVEVDHTDYFIIDQLFDSKDELELEIIKDLSKSPVPPKKIMAHLKQMGLGLNAYMKQIYNAKDHFKKDARGDHTVMQHLIGLLEEHNYYKWIRTDETTHEVIDLMWAHPQSVELLSKFPYVILLDSTYKTNQYKMPLL
ncbi:PREDICTED: uncharacterized protein LOC105971236 [Erythranthe guttata]|uniref:uncharacterized protein LOC105971236 n=1 Tax=Erythranthe guttata TaxID=4155 RepID=UPI00064D740D|nr:PREDICTED: uncharacterized protein LOC105971236 [Erythranthe guttata]|eukprot:XP_012851541.1 PREDICTED: uncharacterized protein LOC105971236 [Erythranthe guttata]